MSDVQESKDFEVEFPQKTPIQCMITAPTKDTASKKAQQRGPALIFTHGAGGGLQAPAVVNFVSGFAKISPMVCFQGTRNLNSRTKMFQAVCQHQGYDVCLGGRSMGARAAVMAATKNTAHLVLVSYPLHTDKATRDQILLDIPEEVNVIFVSGDTDSMCNLGRLKDVRGKMKCKSWQLTVIGADHGMKVKPKSGTTDVGRMTGEVVAKWLVHADHDLTEGSIYWDPKKSQAEWNGWALPENPNRDESESRRLLLDSTSFNCDNSLSKKKDTNHNDEPNAPIVTEQQKTHCQTRSKRPTRKRKRNQ